MHTHTTFKHKLNEPYDNIAFVNTLTDPAMVVIPETNPDTLYKMIQEKLSSGDEGDFWQAVAYAQKLAIFHGVVGLIVYIDLMQASMKNELAAGELIAQQAFNVLCYLQLARRIAEVDEDSLALAKRLLPNVDLSAPDYWDNKQHQISKMADIETLEVEAKQQGNRMFDPTELTIHRV